MTLTCDWTKLDGTVCVNVSCINNRCSRHLKQTCSVCLEPVRSTNSAGTKRLTCGHSFHTDCILPWFATSDECPSCRRNQASDPFIKFRNTIQDNMRTKYMDTIRSYEKEISKLRRQLLLR